MGLIDQMRHEGRASRPPLAVVDTAEATVWAPPPDSYLTDGVELFWVAHTLADPVSQDLFVELEVCRTLELVLCPARAIAASGLRPVTPALAS
jgi:hypothetical protein